MKRNKQINESKTLIFNAFIELLKTKTLEDITMSEIAEEAGVVRMTLYRHFKEKEDILVFAFQQNLAKALDIIQNSDAPTLRDLLIFRFKTLQESPYTNILAKHYKLDKLFQTVGAKNIHHFSDLVPISTNPYSNVFLAGGIDSLTALWIKNGMKESYVEMADQALALIERFSES